MMPARRAIVIVVVLAVIALGALVGSTALYFASAERAASVAGAKRLQARALAWSGVQAAAADLWRQRESILRGAKPTLEPESIVFEDSAAAATGDRGVYRLLPISGALAVGEAGRLDVNSAPADMLVAVGVDRVVAEEIVAARSRRPFGSVAEVTSMPAWSAQGAALRRGSKVGASDLLTVFSFDPQQQSGAAGKSTAGAGAPRVDLSAGWSTDVQDRLTQSLGGELALRLQPLLGAPPPPSEAPADPAPSPKKGPASLGELYEALVRAGFDAPAIDRVLDACCIDDRPFRTGLIDILSASAGVLAAAGFDQAAAEKAVAAREGLNEDERSGLSWLVERRVLTPQQFAALVDRLAARSLQWRILVEGGIDARPALESASASAASSAAPSAAPTKGLRGSVLLEAVIDLSGDRPRVAYLRDVSMLAAADWLDARAAKIFDPPKAAKRKPAGPADAPPRSDPDPGARPPADVAIVPSPDATAPPPPRTGGRLGRWTTGGGSNQP